MDETPKPGRRWLRWALIASLAVNLIFVGLIAGAAYRHAGGPGAVAVANGHGPRSYATPYVRALPRDVRRALFRDMRQGDRGIPDRAGRRAMYNEVLAALRAEPFDADAVAGLVRRQGQVALDLQTAAEGAWLAQVGQMTVPERAAYADRVEEELRRGPHRRDKAKRD